MERRNHRGARAGKLAALVFPEEIRINAIMQGQLADLYVEALHNECVRHGVIKEAPVKLSAAVALSKDSQGGMGEGKEEKSTRAESGSRQAGRGKKAPTLIGRWNGGGVDETEEREEVPNGTDQTFTNPHQVG